MVPSTFESPVQIGGHGISRSRWRPCWRPSRERRGGDRRPAARRPRRAAPRRRRARPAPRPPTRPAPARLSLVSAKTAPRVSFFYGVRNPSLRFEIESTQPQNDLRIDVVDVETGEVVRSFYRNDVEPHTHRRHPLGRRRPHQAAGAERPLQLPGRLAGRPAGRPPRDQLERTAQPRLRLLRLRLPGPRQARLRRRRRPLRRRPRRPHPPGPGRDGRLRPAAGRRPRRAGPVLDLGRPAAATTSSSTARAPPTTPPTCTSPNPRR